MKNQLKWWVLIIVSTVLLIYLMPNSLSVSVNEQLDRSKVKEIAQEFMLNSGYSIDDYHVTIVRLPARFLLAYLKSQLEFSQFLHLVNSDSVPNSRWQILYLRNIPQNQPQTRYTVWISSKGNIVGFQRQLPDTLMIESLSEDQAARMAQIFLTDQINISMNNFILRKSQQFNQSNRTDYTFTWEKPAGFADGKYVIQVFVQGKQIGGYNYLYHLPESTEQEISEDTTFDTFLTLLQFIGLIAIFLFVLILFLKKYHEGEVSTSQGITIFIVVFILGLISSINKFPVTGYGVTIGNMSAFNVKLIMFVYEIVLKNVFIGIFLLTSWAVGEAYARSLWPEKLNSIDSLLNNKFFTLNTGVSVLRGGAIGFATTMVYLIVTTVFTGKDKPILEVSLPFGATFQYYIPVISIVITSVLIALICEVIFRFFIINVVYAQWKRKWLAIIISAIIWPIAYNIFTDYTMYSSMPLNIGLSLIMGIMFGWLYFRYDLLTLIAAMASANLIFNAFPLVASSAEWHRISLYILIMLVLIPVVQIIISFIKKDKFEYTYEGLPGHIRRISERERMQKELEIARNVQMGLLPKSNPNIEGFDISGRCLPAKEVGGDYFDFVTLSSNKLGIAIGDVSGKGVPAAIYMTLTKGILQSHADDTISPRLVLNKVNKLLYRNIEKNSFVSMFYAVLDVQNRSITFARAGHNPGILINQKDGSNQELNTDGIALGLEEGTVFNARLKEQTLSLVSGDTLVFYTDGFTEAMDPQKNEFGEENFVNIISQNRDKPAKELINILIAAVKSFSKDTPQHDDMTVVVIKIL